MLNHFISMRVSQKATAKGKPTTIWEEIFQWLYTFAGNTAVIVIIYFFYLLSDPFFLIRVPFKLVLYSVLSQILVLREYEKKKNTNSELIFLKICFQGPTLISVLRHIIPSMPVWFLDLLHQENTMLISGSYVRKISKHVWEMNAADQPQAFALKFSHLKSVLGFHHLEAVAFRSFCSESTICQFLKHLYTSTHFLDIDIINSCTPEQH